MEPVWISVTIVGSVLCALLLFKLWCRFSFMGQWTVPIICTLWKVPGPKSIPLLGCFVLLWGTPAEIWDTTKKSIYSLPLNVKNWLTNSVGMQKSKESESYEKEKHSTANSSNALHNIILPLLETGLRGGKNPNKVEDRHLKRKSSWGKFVEECRKHCCDVVGVMSVECRKEEPKILSSLTQYACKTLLETSLFQETPPHDNQVPRKKDKTNRDCDDADDDDLSITSDSSSRTTRGKYRLHSSRRQRHHKGAVVASAGQPFGRYRSFHVNS